MATKAKWLEEAAEHYVQKLEKGKWKTHKAGDNPSLNMEVTLQINDVCRVLWVVRCYSTDLERKCDSS